jgi:hypothetical protein
MSDIVERIKVDRWTNRDGEDVTSYKVTLVNETGQREVNCYDPRGKDLKEDAPLPEGWEVKTSKAGKPYLAAPKVSGGGRSVGAAPAAWRNTEAGAKYEQRMMNARTAIMQADTTGWTPEQIFNWIERQSVDGAGGAGTVARRGDPAPEAAPSTPSERPPPSAKRTANEPPAGWDQ